jgi:hypothetical protein
MFGFNNFLRASKGVQTTLTTKYWYRRKRKNKISAASRKTNRRRG